MSRSSARTRLQLVRNKPAEQPAAPAPAKAATWGPLAAPVFPLETLVRSRAQSALCGLQFRDGSTAAPVLTLEQARDVLAWYRRPSWDRTPPL